MKHGMCAGVVLGLCAWSGSAAAQETVGKRGDFAIAIERAFGIYSGHTDYDGPPAADEEYDYTGIEVGIRPSDVMPSNGVRLGLDGYIIDHLSIGGGVGFSSYGDDKDGTLFLIAPRVGYFMGFGQHFGFWPRGGLTIWWTGGTNKDANQVMVTGEAMFTLAPSKSYAFLLGPFFDLGFAGEEEYGDIDRDRTDRLLGISLGMIGYL